MIEISGGVVQIGFPRRGIVRSGDVERGHEEKTGRWGDGWGRGDKRDLLDCMIRAIDMVIGFPKGFDGAYNHVQRGITGGSVSRGVLNDDGGAMLATSGNIKSRTIGARHSASTRRLGAECQESIGGHECTHKYPRLVLSRPKRHIERKGPSGC